MLPKTLAFQGRNQLRSRLLLRDRYTLSTTLFIINDIRNLQSMTVGPRVYDV